MEIEFTDVECKNIILVSMKAIDWNIPSMTGERGIEIEYLSKDTDIEVEKLKQFLNNLSDISYTEWTDNGKIRLKDNGVAYLENNSNYNLTQVADLILKKTYEFYTRKNYDSLTQFNSYIVGCCLGITNNNKVISAVEILINKGYFKKMIMTKNYINYFLSNEGIALMEDTNTDDEVKTTISVINNFYNEVNNSQLQQFSDNSVQNMSIGIDNNTIYKLLGIIEENYKNLDSKTQNSIEPIIANVKTEMKKSNPNNSVIKQSFQTLRTILEGAAGSIIAAGILYYFGLFGF